MTKKEFTKPKKVSPLEFEPKAPAMRPVYLNHHTIGAGARIPSSAYIHIENYITCCKSVAQFDILKKTSQLCQASQGPYRRKMLSMLMH